MTQKVSKGEELDEQNLKAFLAEHQLISKNFITFILGRIK